MSLHDRRFQPQLVRHNAFRFTAYPSHFSVNLIIILHSCLRSPLSQTSHFSIPFSIATEDYPAGSLGRSKPQFLKRKTCGYLLHETKILTLGCKSPSLVKSLFESFKRDHLNIQSLPLFIRISRVKNYVQGYENRVLVK